MTTDPELLKEVQKLNRFRTRMWGDIAKSLPGGAADVRRGMPVDEAIKRHFRSRPDPTKIAEVRAGIIDDFFELQKEREARAGELKKSRAIDRQKLLEKAIDAATDLSQAAGILSGVTDSNRKRALNDFNKVILDSLEVPGGRLDKPAEEAIRAAVRPSSIGHNMADSKAVVDAIAGLPPAQKLTAIQYAQRAWLDAQPEGTEVTAWDAHWERAAGTGDPYAKAVTKMMSEAEQWAETEEGMQAHMSALEAAEAAAPIIFQRAGYDYTGGFSAIFDQVIGSLKKHGFDIQSPGLAEDFLGGADEALGTKAPDSIEKLAGILAKFDQDQVPYSLQEARARFFDTPLWQDYVKKMMGDRWTETAAQNPAVQRHGLRALRQELKEMSRGQRLAAGEWRDKLGREPRTTLPAPSKSAQLAGGEAEHEADLLAIDEVKANPQEWEVTVNLDPEGLEETGFLKSGMMLFRSKKTGEVRQLDLSGLSFNDVDEMLRGVNWSTEGFEEMLGEVDKPGDPTGKGASEQTAQKEMDEGKATTRVSKKKLTLGKLTDQARNAAEFLLTQRPRELAQTIPRGLEEARKKAQEKRYQKDIADDATEIDTLRKPSVVGTLARKLLGEELGRKQAPKPKKKKPSAKDKAATKIFQDIPGATRP